MGLGRWGRAAAARSPALASGDARPSALAQPILPARSRLVCRWAGGRSKKPTRAQVLPEASPRRGGGRRRTGSAQRSPPRVCYCCIWLPGVQQHQLYTQTPPPLTAARSVQPAAPPDRRRRRRRRAASVPRGASPGTVHPPTPRHLPAPGLSGTHPCVHARVATGGVSVCMGGGGIVACAWGCEGRKRRCAWALRPRGRRQWLCARSKQGSKECEQPPPPPPSPRVAAQLQPHRVAGREGGVTGQPRAGHLPHLVTANTHRGWVGRGGVRGLRGGGWAGS